MTAYSYSASLNNEKPVAVRVAEEEHRRHRVSHARDRLVRVDSTGPQVRMVGVDVTFSDPNAFATTLQATSVP